ncbi:response regulator [Halorubrum sp. GN11_10-6_MGM]|uniref:HalX domain-containing protein n=1 Tax=Halorubrum sp. GN11_10-6_MGM TaxID=2518112 RepID=UPI0010F88B73|nr:HalX domain-containing protein [Halorubrum sp. GN11_10-6_MGM]TKX75508.1 response regulator [Halorubrum sp. GN11_10-6_MGM]
MTTTEPPVVLAVDDDEKLLETYEIWLSADYDLRTATGGEEALAKLDEAVDVVLLDRLMPDLSGDDLLEAIRDRDVDCRVAMVTAVEPDLDIVEMPFDTYVAKAIDESTIRETIERLLARADHDDRLREHYAVAEKLATLERRKPESELAASAEYQDLIDRFEELDSTLADTGESLDRDDIVSEIARAEPADRIDEAADHPEDKP